MHKGRVEEKSKIIWKQKKNKKKKDFEYNSKAKNY